VRRAESDAAAPVRILHLSDLHIGAGADPESLWQPLLADLRDAQEGLAAEKVDYLVVSGDITNRASPAEFDRARIFLSRVIDELGLTSQRCVIVPGNHDLDWNTDVYAWKNKRHVDVARLPPGSYTQQGDGYNLRDDARYPERFRNFSASLYHPLMQREYPLSAQDQCVPHLYAEDGLQILALNSAWEIDEYFQERSGINEAALSRGLELADRQIGDERAAGRLAAARPVLRMAVWHHPITGNEKIVADAFLARLRQAGVRLCLHGHVHEDRADLINYLTPTRRIHVAGAGSFGAPTADRPESVPRLYNLLELARDHRSLTVHTRCLRRQGGAWEGWAVWPGRTRGEKRSYYVVDLS
jgi:3',5'-cyclic AMP phosphodiesterase CpdA